MEETFDEHTSGTLAKNLKANATHSSTSLYKVENKVEITGISSEDAGMICRICYGVETKAEKLVTPCLCSGSTKYAHEACLLEWLAVKQSRTCEVCLYPMQIDSKGMKPFWKWRKPKHFCDAVVTLTILYTLVMLMFLVMVSWIATSQCASPICISLYCLCCFAVAYFCYCCKYMRCMKPLWRGFLDVNQKWSVVGRHTSLAGKDGIDESKV